MNPRHAAALALMGWYLMMPPGDSNAPIARWHLIASFDTARECWAEQKQELDYYQDPKHPDVNTWAQWNTAECIATDDPRLKEK